MAEFDPDAYIAKKSEFNPDEYLAAKSDRPRPKLAEGTSALRGAIQGATLGFGDEIYGGLVGAVEKLKGGSFKESYAKARDEERQANKLAASDNPKAYFGGNLAGGLATAVVPGLGALKGASILKTGLQGAAIGGLAGAGASEADLLKGDVGGLAADVGTGAAIGGALGAAGQAAANGIKKLSPAVLKEYANKRALSAAGFMTKDVKKLSPQQQQEIGRTLLDKKVVTALSSLDDVVERAAAGKETAGKAIGNALQTVDDHVKELVSSIDSGKILQDATDEAKSAAKKYIQDNFQFNMRSVGDRIRKELIEPNADNPLVKNELARLTGLADDFAEKGTKSLGFGNVVKATQGKQTRFQSETIPEQFKKEVYTIIKEELENAVGKTGNLEAGVSALGGASKPLGDLSARNAQALSGYKDAKSLYGAMKATEKAATDSLGRTNANQTFGLTDKIAGAAGFIAGGPAGLAAQTAQAAALGTLNKLGRKYGASVQAVGADKLANAIKSVQGVTTDKLAEAIGGTISKSPKLAQRVGGVIAKAATEGKASLVAVHYALMKDPEYRAAMGEEEPPPSNVFERRLNRAQ